MTGRRFAQATSVILGVAVCAGAGALAGGWWWAVALAGAVAAVGSVWDRQLDYVAVLAALASSAGVVAAGHHWYVVVLAVGPLMSIELLAASDRVTVVRRSVPDMAHIASRIPWLVGLAAAVLVVGRVSTEVPVAGVVGAGLAAAMAVRVIAR